MGLVLVIGILGAGSLALWLPRRANERRWENERFASTALKTLSSAEADFRANDRDWNHVNDFWTGDVAGLYNVRPNDGSNGPEIQLIPRVLAEADAAPVKPLCPKPVPYHGYFFMALGLDPSLEDMDGNPLPPVSYRQDTDKKSGKVHSLSNFGFVAFPATPGETGKYFYIINENNSVFRAEATIPFPRNWFTRDERRRYWSLPQ
jgi:hypothetical protein